MVVLLERVLEVLERSFSERSLCIATKERFLRWQETETETEKVFISKEQFFELGLEQRDKSDTSGETKRKEGKADSSIVCDF